MKEKPILFSADMVKAIIEKKKTQTRRIVKPQPVLHNYCDGQYFDWKVILTRTNHKKLIQRYMIQNCPYGQPGGRLWVRETWALVSPDSMGDVRWYNLHNSGRPMRDHPDGNILDGVAGAIYRADGEFDLNKEYDGKGWRPSIFMPRWASRLDLEILSLRVERLQEISDESAIAEGIERIGDQPYWSWKDYTGNGQALSPLMSFESLWDTINARRGYPWEVNPWVWAIEFRRV